jgi:uncharacterized protein (DUF1330 family)
MQSKYKTALAALAGAVLGAAAMQALNAQQTKALPAYVISNIDIADPAPYKKFALAVPATLAPYHAHYLVRGGETVTFDGAPPKRIIVIAFRNLDDAERWRASSEYQKIRPNQQQSFRYIENFAVEGLPVAR